MQFTLKNYVHDGSVAEHFPGMPKVVGLLPARGVGFWMHKAQVFFSRPTSVLLR